MLKTNFAFEPIKLSRQPEDLARLRKDACGGKSDGKLEVKFKFSAVPHTLWRNQFYSTYELIFAKRPPAIQQDSITFSCTVQEIATARAMVQVIVSATNDFAGPVIEAQEAADAGKKVARETEAKRMREFEATWAEKERKFRESLADRSSANAYRTGDEFRAQYQAACALLKRELAAAAFEQEIARLLENDDPIEKTEAPGPVRLAEKFRKLVTSN